MEEARTGPFTLMPPATGPDGSGGDAERPDNGSGPVDGDGSGPVDGDVGGPTRGTGPQRRRGVPSPKLALIVVGIAAFLILLFGIGGALNSGTATPPKPVSVKGAGLPSRPATALLAPVLMADTPPPDILTALVVPAGSVRTKTTKWDGQTQFSATVHVRVPQDQAAVAKFFQTELKGRGWDIVGNGPADHDAQADQVLATKASSDGWYWEVGVTVSPSTFTSGGTTDTTPYTIELYEIQDAT